jgi:hypothetical protein
MRKFISLLFIFSGTVLMLISSSEKTMKKIFEKRSALKGWFGVHHSQAGDLVSMSYLDNVPRFRESYDYYFARPSDTTAERNIDLYIYGDSYLMTIPDSAFGSINQYHFARRSYEDLVYTLNPHKKNILIIEYAERFARGEFGNFEIYHHVIKKQADAGFLHWTDRQNQYASLFGFQLFNHDINRNLEYNLFGYRFWDEVKLAKSSLTYYLFNRAGGDAIVSDDGSRLFLRQTIAPDNMLSSYYPIDQKEWHRIIDNVNAVYDHYKAEGFDEIYLSIIPNPVTVLQPENYNGLIPNLQKAGVLNGMKMIDVYSQYLRDPKPGTLFRIGDTHWSNHGMQVWLKEVNNELKLQGEKANSKMEKGKMNQQVLKEAGNRKSF